MKSKGKKLIGWVVTDQLDSLGRAKAGGSKGLSFPIQVLGWSNYQVPTFGAIRCTLAYGR